MRRLGANLGLLVSVLSTRRATHIVLMISHDSPAAPRRNWRCIAVYVLPTTARIAVQINGNSHWTVVALGAPSTPPRGGGVVMFLHVKRVEFVDDREVGSEALGTLQDLCAG